MRPDRENELDLADIGRETGAHTHGTKIASVARKPKSFGLLHSLQRLLRERPTPERCVEAYYLRRTKFESRASEAVRKRSDGIREFFSRPRASRSVPPRRAWVQPRRRHHRPRVAQEACLFPVWPPHGQHGVSGPSGGRRASDSTPSHHRSHACGKLVWAIARRGDNRGRNYPRPDQDTIAEPRTGIIKRLGLQSPACSGHSCHTFFTNYP